MIKLICIKKNFWWSTREKWTYIYEMYHYDTISQTETLHQKIINAGDEAKNELLTYKTMFGPESVKFVNQTNKILDYEKLSSDTAVLFGAQQKILFLVFLKKCLDFYESENTPAKEKIHKNWILAWDKHYKNTNEPFMFYPKRYSSTTYRDVVNRGVHYIPPFSVYFTRK